MHTRANVKLLSHVGVDILSLRATFRRPGTVYIHVYAECLLI